MYYWRTSLSCSGCLKAVHWFDAVFLCINTLKHPPPPLYPSLHVFIPSSAYLCQAPPSLTPLLSNRGKNVNPPCLDGKIELCVKRCLSAAVHPCFPTLLLGSCITPSLVKYFFLFLMQRVCASVYCMYSMWPSCWVEVGVGRRARERFGTSQRRRNADSAALALLGSLLFREKEDESTLLSPPKMRETQWVKRDKRKEKEGERWGWSGWHGLWWNANIWNQVLM